MCTYYRITQKEGNSSGTNTKHCCLRKTEDKRNRSVGLQIGHASILTIDAPISNLRIFLQCMRPKLCFCIHFSAYVCASSSDLRASAAKASSLFANSIRRGKLFLTHLSQFSSFPDFVCDIECVPLLSFMIFF